MEFKKKTKNKKTKKKTKKKKKKKKTITMKKSKHVINFSSPILLYYECQNAMHWYLTFTSPSRTHTYIIFTPLNPTFI